MFQCISSSESICQCTIVLLFTADTMVVRLLDNLGQTIHLQIDRMNRYQKTIGITQRKLNLFLDDGYDEKKAVDQILRFTSRHMVTISRTAEEYENGHLDTMRVTLAAIYRLCCLITGIRFFMSSAFHNPSMVALVCDPHHLLTNPKLFSMVISCAGFVIFLYGLLAQTREMSRKWHLISFLYRWKHGLQLPLRARNRRKLLVITNLMLKLFMKQSFWVLVAACSLLFNGSSAMAYLENKYNYNLFSMIFFNICFDVFLLLFGCFVTGGFVAWTVSFVYLKYKFTEVNQLIRVCAQYNNFTALSKAIVQHNALSLQTKAIDEVFSILIAILYFGASPALLLLLNLSHAKDSAFILRPIAAGIFAIVFSVVFVLNLIASQISESSRKPLTYLFRYQIDCEISLKDRLKLWQFIEKLCGPDIGLHVWNLFSMNNYTFYQYVCNCAYAYLLILNLTTQELFE